MSRFPRDDYRTLDRYTPDRRPVEVDLSDNTNLWGTHPAALDVVRRADTDHLARYPALYADDLKAAVARRFGVPADCVATGCGSDDVLDAVWRTCAPQGGVGAAGAAGTIGASDAAGAPDVVRYPEPTFSMVEPFSRMNARTPRPVAWSEALDDPACLLADDPALIYVCRPNNPTGHVAPEAWLDGLLDAAEARPDGGPVVVIDEAYADFAGESCIPRVLERKRTAVARTLSKAYGLAGLRIGFAVGNPVLIDEIEKARGPYKVSRLAEAAAVAALEDVGGWMERTTAEAVRNRERLTDALEERGLEPLPSRANFVLFPVPAGTAGPRALALRERGVAVRPFPHCADVGDALRVTVGPWPLMERFLEALDQETARTS